MPRTKLDKPKYPPIDWTLAAILERKKTMKLEWSDIARKVGMSPESLRVLVCRKAPRDWPSDTRERICKLLGVEVKTFVVGSPEDPTL